MLLGSRGRLAARRKKGEGEEGGGGRKREIWEWRKGGEAGK